MVFDHTLPLTEWLKDRPTDKPNQLTVLFCKNLGVEEGTFVLNHEGEVLNSKNECRQPKIIRLTILQGGAEMAGAELQPSLEMEIEGC